MRSYNRMKLPEIIIKYTLKFFSSIISYDIKTKQLNVFYIIKH